MTDIVAIHGINMHRSDRETMQRNWRAELIRGLTNIRSPHADDVTLECAFYGHEYNDGKAGLDDGLASIDVKEGFELELLLAIAAAVESDEPDETKLYLPQLVQQALTRIERWKGFEGPDRVAIYFVKQVHRYLFDDNFRARVLDETSKAMQSHPRVVIGHSLGSIVAYDWLVTHPDSPPTALITIGSPLGLKSISSRLPHAERPPSIRSWTNIAAHHDGVAMVKKLAPSYSTKIVDLPCDNPRKSAHSALVYLGNVHVADAVDTALG